MENVNRRQAHDHLSDLNHKDTTIWHTERFKPKVTDVAKIVKYRDCPATHVYSNNLKGRFLKGQSRVYKFTRKPSAHSTKPFKRPSRVGGRWTHGIQPLLTPLLLSNKKDSTPLNVTSVGRASIGYHGQKLAEPSPLDGVCA